MTPNLSAFLRVIRACEGTAGPDGYRTLFGGGLFDSYADHPRIVVERGRYRSTAAGAYQILARTWDWFISKNGPHDFSPDNQDLCARWLIQQRGAIGDVEAGRLEVAITKCAKEWASLPGSPYGQPTRTLEYCRRVYVENGGRFEPSKPPSNLPSNPTEPVPEVGTPVPNVGTPTEPRMPIFAALLPTLLGLIPQLASIIKPKSEVAARNVELATLLTSTLTEATQSVNLQQAVEKMQTDPEAKAAASVAVQQKWFEISEVMQAADKVHSFESAAWASEEASKDAAAARGAQMQESGPLFRNPQFIVATYVMVLVAVVVVLVMLKDVMFKDASGFSTDMQAFVIGAIVGSALTAVLAYFFGTSRSSAAKDVVISEMSRRAQ